MRDIVSEMKAGNIVVFREFFEDYYPVLCSFAMKYVRDKEKSKDVAQDVLLKYWETRMNYASISEVRGFLYVAVRNQCFNLLKRTEIGERYLREMFGEEEDDFEEQIMEHEIVLLLHQAVDQLPSQMRKIIRLSLDGMKNSEIAKELEISDGSLHTLKKIAYKKLRKMLKEHVYLLLFF